MTEIYELSPSEVRNLMVAFSEADLEGKSVKVTVDGGLKVKVGGGMWTPPLGAGCTCPKWDSADDFDGPEDYENACRGCPIHG